MTEFTDSLARHCFPFNQCLWYANDIGIPGVSDYAPAMRLVGDVSRALNHGQPTVLTKAVVFPDPGLADATQITICAVERQTR